MELSQNSYVFLKCFQVVKRKKDKSQNYGKEKHSVSSRDGD